ncbi:MAG TPA: twin-arginine translocase TatA/TatE family subunit [Thermomicrobiaceae bacterium]|nr:twin-arginine translocase TatA/TatE family subunit [Thermomicrobiaceae bacterium]
MNFFGIGPLEMLVILMVALVIFGPGKLPEMAQTIGKGIREFREATGDLTGEFQSTIDEMRNLAGDLDLGGIDLNGNSHASNGSAANRPTVYGQTVLPDQAVNIAPPAPRVETQIPQAPPPVPLHLGGNQRVPTKADPLADFMPIDASNEPS